MPPRGFDRGGHSRRQFLTRAGLAALGGPALLAACTREPGRGVTTVKGAEPLKLASPQNPVRWNINPGNEPIKDGMAPEKNATLQVYNYADYLDPGGVKAFGQKYGCKVQLSTFNDMDEALTKIRQGSVPFDIWIGPGYDLTSRLITTSLIRPLNHSYIPNIKNVWPVFTNPWYDQGWQYTIPYTVYTTGIGWRLDKVPVDIAKLPNPYDTLWNPEFKNQTAVLDDYRSTIEMCLLRAGITDVNTDKAGDLDKAAAQLTELTKNTDPKITISMYSDLPAGAYGQAAMWSGDVVNAAWDGAAPPEVFRYWFPADGKGMVDNDLVVAPAGGKNPVLAHLFLNHLLDLKVATGNLNFTGYQPPQVTLKPETLIEQEFIPSNLTSVVVKESDFKVGYPALELSTEASNAWHSIWLAFKAGN